MAYFAFRRGRFELGKRTYIMGIVNITPDSFSDGGKYFSTQEAIEHALHLVEDGADMIDLGACSTKPFSVPVSSQTEQNRLLPVVEGIKKYSDIPMSVDTFYYQTAQSVLNSGVDVINDVGGKYNNKMASLIRQTGAGYIVMHGGVNIAPAQSEHKYKNGLITDVNTFFSDIKEKLQNDGIPSENICLDPGFGFMKNTNQNLFLLKNLSQLNTQQSALLIGLSRKRFIGELSGEASAQNRFAGSLTGNILATENGADIIRTHEVKLHKQALCFMDRYKYL